MPCSVLGRWALERSERPDGRRDAVVPPPHPARRADPNTILTSPGDAGYRERQGTPSLRSVVPCLSCSQISSCVESLLPHRLMVGLMFLTHRVTQSH